MDGRVVPISPPPPQQFFLKYVCRGINRQINVTNDSRMYKLPNHLKTSVFLSINLYLKFIFTKSETIYQEQIKQGLNYHLIIKL